MDVLEKELKDLNRKIDILRDEIRKYGSAKYGNVLVMKKELAETYIQRNKIINQISSPEDRLMKLWKKVMDGKISKVA